MYNITIFFQITFNGNEFLCHRCWQSQLIAPFAPQDEPPALADAAVPIPAVPPAPLPPPVPEAQEQLGVVTLEYTRSPNTSTSCVFFGCNRLTRRCIPITLKRRLLFELNIIYPQLQEYVTYIWSQMIGVI